MTKSTWIILVIAVGAWVGLGFWECSIMENHWRCWVSSDGQDSVSIGEHIFDASMVLFGPLGIPAVLIRERLDCDP
jgi:hypothetical protein